MWWTTSIDSCLSSFLLPSSWHASVFCLFENQGSENITLRVLDSWLIPMVHQGSSEPSSKIASKKLTIKCQFPNTGKNSTMGRGSSHGRIAMCLQGHDGEEDENHNSKDAMTAMCYTCGMPPCSTAYMHICIHILTILGILDDILCLASATMSITRFLVLLCSLLP